MQAQPKDVIQIVDGDLRGLFAQVVEVEAGNTGCLCRDFDGTPRFFSVKDSATYRLIGIAALGPRMNGQLSTQPEPVPALPPPINPREFLEPLPKDVKAVPMSDEQLPKVPPPLTTSEQKNKEGARKRVAGINALPKATYIATVRNAVGDEAKVTVNGREGKKPESYTGIAILLAGNVIPRKNPMTVTEWKLKERMR
jgi:hypothetical protein